MVLSAFGDVIGNLLGSPERSYRDEDTISTCFKPGVIVDFGIFWVQFLRKVLVAGLAVGSSPVPNNTKCDQVCRASELPLYMKENDCAQTIGQELCPPRTGIIEGTFGAIRRQIWNALDKCEIVQRKAEDGCDAASEYATSMLTYLKEADDTTKMGAVGAGSVTGFILSLRGGIIRKLLFSGVGAYSMASICYPEKTNKLTKEAISEARKYSTIAYNFIYGVKKDDISLPQLPKLPTSMNEVWEIAGSIGKSASSLISDKGKEAEIAAASKQVRSSDEVIQESHDNALHRSCHCPVGACLGRHDSDSTD